MGILKYGYEKLFKIKRMSYEYIENDINQFQRLVIIFDLFIAIVIYGCGITDYFQYQFYKRRHLDKKNFMVHRKRMWLVRNFNSPGERKIFDHKPSFNKKFNDYLGRAWLDTGNCTFNQFKEFACKEGRFLIKPAEGSHGIGIRVVDVKDQNDLQGIYEKLKEEEVLVEEIIIQHEQLELFNPSSVNTLRVVTLLDDRGKVNIITANLRLGNGDGRFADNFHHNGIAALLDTETGLAVSRGVDKNLNYYIYHPLTGRQIVGFLIPEWAKVSDIVKQAALVVPQVRYVGWDLAIGKDRHVYLIEGNAAADPDISQMPDQVGKWPLYRKVITGM